MRKPFRPKPPLNVFTSPKWNRRYSLHDAAHAIDESVHLLPWGDIPEVTRQTFAAAFATSRSQTIKVRCSCSATTHKATTGVAAFDELAETPNSFSCVEMELQSIRSTTAVYDNNQLTLTHLMANVTIGGMSVITNIGYMSIAHRSGYIHIA